MKPATTEKVGGIRQRGWIHMTALRKYQSLIYSVKNKCAEFEDF